MTFHNDQRTHVVLVGLLILLIGAIVILSWVPPVDRDALTHHLFVPKLYLKHGGIYQIPNIPFSYYPMNLDLLYLIPLYFRNDIIPKLIHFAFALLTAWLIYGYLKNRTDTSYALAGVLFFLSLPVIVKLSITVYVDLGLIFFTTASLLLLLKWLETSRAKWLIVSGIMCGLALGTKYNGLVSLLLLTLFVPVAYLRYPGKRYQDQWKALKHTALFVLVAIVVFSPWMIRNYLWTQNPVFPLFNHRFNLPAPRITETRMEGREVESNQELKPFALRKAVYKESGWEIITIPVRIFFQGKDDNPKYFDGKLNIFLLFFPLFLLFRSKDYSDILRFEEKVFALFSILFLLLVFFQSDMRIRYAGPMIPPLVILSILGLKRVLDFIHKKTNRGSKIASVLTFGIFCVVIFFPNFSYIHDQFKGVDPIPFILGRITREDYIERYRPEYRLIRYANEHLPETSNLLFLFIGNRGYYSDREVFFGFEWLKEQLHKTRSTEHLREAFQKMRITHLLVRTDLLDRWIHEDLHSDLGKMFSNFLNDTTLLKSHAGYALYEL